MIAWDRIDELKSEIGEDDFLEIVALFLEETEAALARLGETTDPDEAEALLHFLKGSALNLGFRALGRLCRDRRPPLDDKDAWPSELAEVRKIYELSKAHLLAAHDDDTARAAALS